MSTPHGTVQYAYSAITSTLNDSRLVTMTYPNSRQITFNYGTSGSVDNAISRLTGIKDSGASFDLEDYSYSALDSVVQRTHPQDGINLAYIGGTSDLYGGLDRFGRVVDQL